jgi:hypothetical protein
MKVPQAKAEEHGIVDILSKGMYWLKKIIGSKNEETRYGSRSTN